MASDRSSAALRACEKDGVARSIRRESVILEEMLGRRTVDDQPQIIDGGVLLHLLHLDSLHLFFLRFVFGHCARCASVVCTHSLE